MPSPRSPVQSVTAHARLIPPMTTKLARQPAAAAPDAGRDAADEPTDDRAADVSGRRPARPSTDASDRGCTRPSTANTPGVTRPWTKRQTIDLIERRGGRGEHRRRRERERRGHNHATLAPRVGEPPDERRRQRHRRRRRRHRQADGEVAGAEHVLEQRQQRLRGVQAQKRREAREHDREKRAETSSRRVSGVVRAACIATDATSAGTATST